MLDQIIVFMYLGVLLIIGYISANKMLNADTKKYTQGNQKYNYFIIMAAITATYIGGGFTIGLAEKVFTFGIGYVICMWGYSLKEIIVAKYIVPKFHRFKNVVTVGDIIGQKLGKSPQIFTGILSMVVCCGIVGAQFSACGYIAEVFFGINYTFAVVICSVVVITYVSFGGMEAVMAGDTIHFLVLAVSIPLIFFLGYNYVGGYEALTATIHNNFSSNIGNITIYQILGIFIAMFIGEVLVPPYVQRILVSKNQSQAKKGAFISAVLSLAIFFMIGIIGLIAFHMNPNINPNNALPLVIQTVLPVGIKGISIAGILAAIMSSADAFLNAAGISLVNDVILKLKKSTKQVSIVTYRNITVLLGSIALMFSLAFTNVMDLLLFTYQFWTPIIIVPLICILFKIKIYKKFFWFGSLGSLTTILVASAFNSTWIPNSLFGILVNIICLIFFKLQAKYQNTSLEEQTSLD